jgi:hypothetical protein
MARGKKTADPRFKKRVEQKETDISQQKICPLFDPYSEYSEKGEPSESGNNRRIKVFALSDFFNILHPWICKPRQNL